jgi:hypothetical protein
MAAEDKLNKQNISVLNKKMGLSEKHEAVVEAQAIVAENVGPHERLLSSSAGSASTGRASGLGRKGHRKRAK